MNFTTITAYLNIQRQSTTRSLQGANDSCSLIGATSKHDIVEIKIITVSKVFRYDSALYIQCGRSLQSITT